MKEFKDAETGITQGIPMSRRSKQTEIFKGHLKKLILAGLILNFIWILEAGSFAKSSINTIIDEFYDKYSTDGTLNVTEAT